MTDDIIDLSQYSDRVIHETKVDFSQRIIVKPIHIMQYDNKLPIVAVSLFDNGVQYTIPQGAKVFFRWSKKDHNFIRKEVLGRDAGRHTVYFEVSSNMAFYYGTHNPIIEVRLSDNFSESEAFIPENDKVMGSSYMLFEIDRNPIQLGDMESTTEFVDLSEYVDAAAESAAEASAGAAYVRTNKEQAVAEIREAADEEITRAQEIVSHAINTFEIGDDGQTMPSEQLIVGGIFYEKM